MVFLLYEFELFNNEIPIQFYPQFISFLNVTNFNIYKCNCDVCHIILFNRLFNDYSHCLDT